MLFSTVRTDAEAFAADPAELTRLLESVDTRAKTLSTLESSQTPATNFLSAREYEHPALSVPVTLTAHTIPLSELIVLVAEQTGISCSIDEDVKDKICSGALYEQPLSQALKVFLEQEPEPAALMAEGNLFRIGKRSRIEALLRERADKKLRASLRTRVVSLKYRVLSESVIKALSAAWQRYVSGERNTLCTFCPQERQILFRGSRSAFRKIKKIINAFDRPYRQVKLSVWLTVLDTALAQQVGSDWFGSGEWGPCRFDKSMPEGGASGFSVGIGHTDATHWLRAVLTAAERSKRARTLLQPSIMTRDGVPAFIWQGQSIPIESTREVEKMSRILSTRSVVYKDVGIKITATPRVLPDERVELVLSIENSRVMRKRNTTGVYPHLAVAKTEHTVIVKNNNMAMIGGLVQKESENHENGIPFLRKIPILGKLLFGGLEDESSLSRLCIFISPTLV